MTSDAAVAGLGIKTSRQLRQASSTDGAARIYIFRVYEITQNEAILGFTKKYGVKTLVWFEHYQSRDEALARERALKKWNRQWKLGVIEASNPDWHDLTPEIYE